MKKILLLVLIGCSLSMQSISQDRRVDVLEVLYNQHNYKAIARKTKKLIDKKGYEDVWFDKDLL